MNCARALALLVCSSVASAQGWNRLPLPDDFGWDADLRLAPDGTPYLGFLGPGGNARVSRWAGAAWEGLGGPSCSTSWQSTLFFSAEGVPYYASRDYGSAGLFNVQRFDAGQWERLTICGRENGYGEILVASVHDPAGLVLDVNDQLSGDPDGAPLSPSYGKRERVVVLVNDGYPESDPDYPNVPPELQGEYPTVVWGNDGDWGYMGSRRFSGWSVAAAEF